MNKLLLPMLIALSIIVTISSCKKEPEDLGADMYGTYTGKFTGPVKVILGTSADVDTTFAAPGLDATGTLSATTYDDSLSLNVNLNVDGTPIDITVLGHIDSKTAFTVSPRIYKYLGAIDLLVSGSGTVTGNDATVNVILKEPDGTTDLIFGDIDFNGTK